jgi:hypothetical protein
VYRPVLTRQATCKGNCWEAGVRLGKKRTDSGNSYYRGFNITAWRKPTDVLMVRYVQEKWKNFNLEGKEQKNILVDLEMKIRNSIAVDERQKYFLKPPTFFRKRCVKYNCSSSFNINEQ